MEYDVNPNLRIDIREKEMQELTQILNNNGMNLKSLSRIECYDISNLQGTNATGSMVVFIHGEKEGSQYRKFKIKKDGKPDDYEMMKEVLKRRFKHKEWDFPNLIIVDGGKGQVSTAQQILQEYNLNIPLIGLAKREETIVIPKFSISSFEEVLLPKNSLSLHLIMRIRDEAHRFAITYHKKLRSRAIFSVSRTPSENKGKRQGHLR
jgi:excinuclease ABC subunit C